MGLVKRSSLTSTNKTLFSPNNLYMKQRDAINRVIHLDGFCHFLFVSAFVLPYYLHDNHVGPGFGELVIH